MPFTLSHSATAIPLTWVLGRLAVPSALVIGAMTPDFAYFLPIEITRRQSHSLPGLVWFCLPAGLLAYLVFHLVMKAPLVGLLPDFVADRIHTLGRSRLPSASWLGVVVSLAAGAFSHIVWDAFTHGSGSAIRLFPVLVSSFQVGPYRVPLFKILQHASTVFGLAVLAAYSAHWLLRAPALPMPRPVVLTTLQRLAVTALVLVATAVWGLTSAAPVLANRLTPTRLQEFAGIAAVEGISALVTLVIVFSVVWHVAGLYRGGPGASHAPRRPDAPRQGRGASR
jgi:hypothetical protein